MPIARIVCDMSFFYDVRPVDDRDECPFCRIVRIRYCRNSDFERFWFGRLIWFSKIRLVFAWKKNQFFFLSNGFTRNSRRVLRDESGPPPCRLSPEHLFRLFTYRAVNRGTEETRETSKIYYYCTMYLYLLFSTVTIRWSRTFARRALCENGRFKVTRSFGKSKVPAFKYREINTESRVHTEKKHLRLLFSLRR